MGDRVPEPVKRERVAALRRLSADKAERFASRFVATERTAVIESARAALTDNYLRVRLEPGPGARPRALTRIAIGGNGRCLTGRVVAAVTDGECNPAGPAGDQAVLEVQ